MQKTWVPSLGQEDPPEESMAAHPNILAWRIPWTEETGGLQSVGSQRVGLDQATKHESEKESNLPNITRLVNSQISEQKSLSRV